MDGGYLCSEDTLYKTCWGDTSYHDECCNTLLQPEKSLLHFDFDNMVPAAYFSHFPGAISFELLHLSDYQ